MDSGGAPKLWGEHRDRMMEALEIGIGEGGKQMVKLQPMESEPNLWKVVVREEDLRERPMVLGLVMTYVDDMFVVGKEEIVP